MNQHDEVAPPSTKCPWCGARGPDFDESPCPTDFCGHDPALVERGGLNLRNLLHAQIDDAEKRAASGCGLSDVLYEARVQAAYAEILGRSPAAVRDSTEAALKARGFDPNFVAYQAAEGECGLTGIGEYWCPCGRHP